MWEGKDSFLFKGQSTESLTLLRCIDEYMHNTKWDSFVLHFYFLLFFVVGRGSEGWRQDMEGIGRLERDCDWLHDLKLPEN